jgi:hypothetical protein
MVIRGNDSFPTLFYTTPLLSFFYTSLGFLWLLFTSLVNVLRIVIILPFLACSFFLLFVVLTVITRSGGEYQTHNGYTSSSPGQPYTTDPKWAKETLEWRKFQGMGGISWMRETGEFRSGTQKHE